jgi:hypothetical protein
MDEHFIRNDQYFMKYSFPPKSITYIEPTNMYINQQELTNRIKFNEELELSKLELELELSDCETFK